VALNNLGLGFVFTARDLASGAIGNLERNFMSTRDGRVAVQLRGRRRGGAGHVVLEPVRFLRRLAWLIPPPGSPQVRFAGVLAGHAAWRSRVVPAGAFAAAVEGEGRAMCRALASAQCRGHRLARAAAPDLRRGCAEVPAVR
jgi:hypothetical protein